MQVFTIADFNAKFPDEATALDYILHLLYPNGVTCKNCGIVTKHYRIAGRKVYGCGVCGAQTSPAAGTILHKSPTPLRLWLHAIFLMASTRCGISAAQLQREIGVTYKTAWRMFTQIRKLLNEGNIPLSGQIEVDETYIGGKRPGKRGRGATGKTIAIGMIERKGKAIVQVTADVKAKTLLPIIQEHIPTAPGTVIYTDELHSYDRLGKLGYVHETIQHAARQYVSGNAHVNNVEGLWSTVKGGISGVNRHVSPKHLQGYLDAYVFRYNHRDDLAPMFLTVMAQLPKVKAAE